MKKLISIIVATVAALTCVVGAAGCGGSGRRAASDTIRYIVYSSGGSLDDSDRIKEAVNKRTKAELGFSVDFEYLGYDDYANKLGLYFGSNEDFDMCFTGSILSGLSYSDRASGGYFMDITDLLPKYAPTLWASMSAETWDAARINGRIYGVINEQIFARSVGLCIDKDIAEAIGLTQDVIDEEELTYKDCINRAMNYIKNEPSISEGGKVPSTTLVIGEAWSDIFMQNYALDSLGADALIPGIIEAEKDTTESGGKPQVINQYQSEYFREFVEFCREMYDKGYISKEQASNPITANQRVRITGTYKPGAEATLYNAIGREFVQFRFGTPLLTTYNVTTSMTGINSQSGNADKCLKFIELMYKDKSFYNLVAIGEEDLDYRWKTAKDDNNETYEYISYIKQSKYKLNTDWSVGTEFNVYRKYLQSATVVEETRELNATSKVSPAYGFTFLPTSSLRADMSSCYMVASTQIKQLLNGTYDNSKTTDEIINKLVSDLNSNGAQRIISAKQTQLDAFINNKNK